MTSSSPLLEVDNISLSFSVGGRDLHALRNVSLAVTKGEVVGLVGESGSGKSTVAKAVMGLYPPQSGNVRFKGQDVTHMGLAARREIWKQMQLIFQDPYSSLNPRMTVGQILAEPFEAHRMGSRAEIEERCRELVTDVGLPTETLLRYPSQFSGGQRQRIAIARALALSPELLIADEPVSALDVSVQAQIVNLFKDVLAKRGIGLMIIAHDLALLYHFADRLVVMYAGEVVEEGPTREVVANPRHPYTLSLIQASPEPEPGSWRGSILLAAEPPSPFEPPQGCAFMSRCPLSQPDCATTRPVMRNVTATQRSACFYPDAIKDKGLLS
ncbi:ABC transporter ATP-binding protein [Govanella unica]|uniref:ABC transporter ATP-binding protein n=1 Tax=Govanella unica TaxID=2975056 RepID=A0A9X3TWC7_9PROT|nr:ABC transporter ATP-binding protein [Govania unica]MDA5192914.1 ABC transporter ATP-binding protein [Govania unica]